MSGDIKDQLGPWQHEHRWGEWERKHIDVDESVGTVATYDGETRKCLDCDALEWRTFGLIRRVAK